MFVFRPILNTSAEYANFQFPAHHQATYPYITEMSWYIFSGAIVANLFVLYLSFFSPLITGKFKYFMANLAFCDLSLILSVCFEAGSQMYHDFMNVPFTATTCYARGVFPYAFSACMMGFALPLTAASRYIVIVMRRGDWLTKRRVFLLCVCSYLPLTGPLVDFLFAPYVTNYLDCDFILYTPYIMEIFLFEFLLVGMPVLCFCSVRVYQLLSQQISIVSARLNTTPEQISIEKSIFKAVVIQSLIPVICALPMVFILFIVLLLGWDTVALNQTIFRYGENQEYHFTTTYLCLGIMGVVPVLDPFITLRVVESYREATNKFLAKFKFYRKLTGAKLEETVTYTVHFPLRVRSAVAPSEPIEA